MGDIAAPYCVGESSSKMAYPRRHCLHSACATTRCPPILRLFVEELVLGCCMNAAGQVQAQE
jgi:hypothetical protein